MVGLFMAGGITIGVVAIIWLGMSKFFDKGSYYSIFFDESVQGLNVDAPVKYRGVAIGRVDTIRVAADSRLIEVVIKIESDLGAQQDMAAQLKVVGITGNMFIELDRVEAEAQSRSPMLNFPTEYPVLASRPSDIKEILHDIDDIVGNFKKIDFQGISDRLKTTMENFDQMVRDSNVPALTEQIRATVANVDQTVQESEVQKLTATLRQTIERVDASVVAFDSPEIARQLKTTLDNFNQDIDPAKWEKVIDELYQVLASVHEATASLKPVMDNAATLVGGAESSLATLNKHLIPVGRDLEKASSKLNDLLDTVNDQPSQLIFGQPPARRFEE